MERRSLVASLMAVGLLVGAGAVRAQSPEDGARAVTDSDLLELLNVEVSTATKTTESLDDAPAVIKVVTADDIARWGYQSVGEALQHVVGFYLIDDHIIPNAGVRGVTGGLASESGMVKVMIDGASVAYRTTSGNWLGVELVPLTAVKQIEIIRGPASALYGADAFLGVINIITLGPEDLPRVDARGHVSAIDDNPGGQFDLTGGARWRKFDLMVSAAGEVKDRAGLRMPEQSPAVTVPSYNDPDAPAVNLARKSLVGMVRAGYRVPDKGQLVLTGVVSGIERGGDFAHWAQLTGGVDDAGRKVGTVINLGQVRLTSNGLLHVNQTLDLALMATYFQGQVLGDDRIEVASDLYWVKRQSAYRGVDGSLEARWVPTNDFNLIVGAETVVDNERKPAPVRVSKDTGEEIGPPAQQASVTLTNVGAYLSTNYKLLDPWLKLTGGARVDVHSIYGLQPTGRVGATSRWSESIVAKLLYGAAFKAPSPYLLYAQPLRPGDVIGNANLKPQRIDTFEFQLSYKPSPLFQGTSGVAYSLVRDKAEFTPRAGNLVAENIASQRSLSWETRIDSNYEDKLRGYASFELVVSRRETGREGYADALIGNENVAYPPWILRAGLSTDMRPSWKLPLQASIEGMYVAPRAAADASILENGARFELPSYFWLNASLATPKLFLIAGHETTIALRGKNLLGVSGPDPGFSGFELPLVAREIMLELRHTY